MIYNVLWADKCIGTTDFVSIDAGVGVALGTFTPTPEYDEARPVFRLFAQAMSARDQGSPYNETLNDYYKKRDALQLSLETAEKHPIPVEWVHIVELLDETGDFEVEAKLSNYTDLEKLSKEIALRRK